ncbi:MAG: DUF2341 domain-containing protein [Promethearchaeota archaeon]
MKKRKYFFFILFILIFNIFSIILLPNSGIEARNYENFNDNPDSRINLSNNPPDKNQFNYYKEIIIDHSRVSGLTPLNDFPFLISVFDSDLHENAQSSGNDIAFSDGITWLDHEMELFERDYNATHAKLVVWVRLPSLSTTVDTNIYLYYGNATMSPRENPTGVWDTNYKGVWHSSEDPPGTIYDSTSNDNDGTPQGSMSSTDQVDGQIGGSLNFDGNDEYIDCGNPTELQITGSITVEAWFKADYLGNTYLISKNGPSDQRCWDISFDDINSTHGYLIYRYALNGEGHADDVGNVSVPINQWHHVVGVFDASTYSRLFLNGQMVDENTTNILASQYDAPNAVRFGARGDVPPPNYFNGTIDEVRISNIARSADWIKTEYDNQFDPSSFYTIGKEYSVPDHPPNAHYFSYYKEIILDYTKVSGSFDLINFPVLISNFDKDLHDKVQVDGDDIAFSDGTSWMDYEIELFDQDYNATHAQLVAWVLIPRLSASKNTIVRMYYGNSTMDSGENPEDLWSNNYNGVWHLSENTGSALDSTSYNTSGTVTGTVTRGSTGKADGAYNFGTNGQINFGDPTDGHLDFGTGSFTISFWLNITADNDWYQLPIYKGATTFDEVGYDFETNADVSSLSFRISDGTNVGESPHIDISGDIGDWLYITGVVDRASNRIRIFKNGLQEGSGSDISSIGNINSNLALLAPSSVYDLYGLLDEIRICNVQRSAGWISTEYRNQNDPGSFYSFGKEYTLSGDPANQHYFTYYKEITVDHTMVNGPNDLFNFPLLVSTFEEDLANKVQEDGDDIAFSYNGAWLDHEIELFNQNYNSSHAQLITWISIPRLSTSKNTVIRMYYGNSTMESRENPTGVWNDNYLGVWHLSESSGDAEDSTSYGTGGALSGSITQGTSGQMGNSYYFDRDGIGTVNMGDPSDGHLDFRNGDDFSISFWINLDYFNFYSPFVVSKRSSGSSSSQGYSIQMYDDGQGIPFYEISSNGPEYEVDGTNDCLDQGWKYVVLVWDEDNSSGCKVYLDGSDETSSRTGTIGSIDDISNNANFKLNGPSSPNSEYMFDGKLDEVRVSNNVRSTEWIATEYNNQFNPQSFLTIGSEERYEITPPTYSNLIESSDPLELGDTEVISINVTDPSGINQVKIEFTGSNHTMTNIGGDIWQYNTWIPNSVDNYTYTIWMEDNYNNWNSTLGTIEVIDTTPPTYSDLIESADLLQIGQNETISIKVYDSPGSGVNQTILEYDSSNHTMIFIGGNTWSWNKWKPISLGIHSYTIYMQDMENNWNMTSGTITVVSTTAPVIENLTESEDPLELGNIISIRVDVFDNESYVDTVLIELEGYNHTMTNTSLGNTYEINWTRSYVGIVYYTIYTNDSANNWNSYSNSFDIVDTTPPAFSDLFKSEDPLEFGDTVIISVNSTDLADINQLRIEFMGSNNSMSNISGDIWQYDSWTPDNVGNYTYTIWAKDNNNNWGFISDSILVQDTTPPIYSDLTESSNTVELGDLLVISINSTDLANIKDISIEFENSNHTMTNIEGDIWQYNSWLPNSIGNYTYNIYITDYNNNWNSVGGSIVFQDTIIPIHSNLFESADPLELGDNQIIRIDIYDFAGINQSLIELEGANYSMTNIYGETWQYDLWTPNDWIVHQYTIYMEDKSGNWDYIIANITVQDTTPPSLPLLANSPSGDVRGSLVFDWSDGFDHSGILYYILIIDNETDPDVTPGYVFFVNITNVGSESSYYELSVVLPLGSYHYFLAQIDGVGHQSSYTQGTFTVISTPGNNNLILIVVIALASVIGSVSAIVIVRKKLKKDIAPPRKKISFKIITSHINKLSSSQFTLQAEEIQSIISDGKQDQPLASKELTDEEELEKRINEIRIMGEGLFADGAYLEAQEQFKLGRDLLFNLGREEEAKLFSDLSSGIEGLIEEREKRLEILDQMKIEGNSKQIFELHQEIIKISKKLRDPDAASFYQSELIQYFQNNYLNVVDLEVYRSELNQKAKSLFNNNIFEMAAQLYEKCEIISQLFVQLGRDEDIPKIREFGSKKTECLKKINNK